MKRTVGLLCAGLLFWFLFLFCTSLPRCLGLVHCRLCCVQHPSWLPQALQKLTWGSFVPSRHRESAVLEPLQRRFGRVHDKHGFHLKPVNSKGNYFLPKHRKDQFVTGRQEKAVSRSICVLHLFISLSFVHLHAYLLFWSHPHWQMRKYTVQLCSHLWRVHFFCPILLGIARSLGCRFESSPVHCTPAKHSVNTWWWHTKWCPSTPPIFHKAVEWLYRDEADWNGLSS